MKKSKIFFIIILYLFFWFLGKIFAQNNGSYNINYSENFPNNIGIFQSLNNGWATARNNYKNIMTPEWCRKITSNRGELFFIPTKTTNEWNNFKSHLPSGIGIGSCDLICNPNFHKEWNSCISNTKSCTITNWTWNQIWNGSSWWSCQVVSCDSWYNKVWNSCIKANSNCSARNINWYNIPNINHLNSTQITKTINWSPANWSTTYTATASCNNGNITIAWESSRINCGSGYNLSWNSCVVVDKLKQLFPDYTRPKAWTIVGFLEDGYGGVSVIHNLPKNTQVYITDNYSYYYTIWDEWNTFNEWRLYFHSGRFYPNNIYLVKLKNNPDVLIYKFMVTNYDSVNFADIYIVD